MPVFGRLILKKGGLDMTLMKLSPIRELEEMRRDLDKLFGDVAEPINRRLFRPTQLESGVFFPNIDMFDKNGTIVVRADLPGVEKENIDIAISNDTLTIKGEFKEEEDVKEEDFYSCERSRGAFSRTVQLPVEIDSTKAKADYKNGVLEITLPVKEESKQKTVKIDVA